MATAVDDPNLIEQLDNLARNNDPEQQQDIIKNDDAYEPGPQDEPNWVGEIQRIRKDHPELSASEAVDAHTMRPPRGQPIDDPDTIARLEDFIRKNPPEGFTPPPEQPEAEGALGTAARAAAHSTAPFLASVGAGAAIGGALGGPAAPITAGVGAVIGGLLTYPLARSVQENLFKRFGWDDQQQQAANVEAHPYAAMAGEFAPAVATFGVGGGAQIAMRALNAGIMGATDLYNTGDPTHAAVAAVGGAALGRPRALTASGMEAAASVGARAAPYTASTVEPVEKIGTTLARRVQNYFNTTGGEQANAAGGDPTMTAGLQRNVLQRGRSGRPTVTEPFNTGADDAILEAGAATREGKFRAGRPDEAEDKLGVQEDKAGVQNAGTDTPGADAAPGVAEPAVPVNKRFTLGTIGNEYHAEGSNRLYSKVRATQELHVIPEDGVAPDVQSAINREPVTQQTQQDQLPTPRVTQESSQVPPPKPGGSGEPLPPLAKGEAQPTPRVTEVPGSEQPAAAAQPEPRVTEVPLGEKLRRGIKGNIPPQVSEAGPRIPTNAEMAAAGHETTARQGVQQEGGGGKPPEGPPPVTPPNQPAGKAPKGRLSEKPLLDSAPQGWGSWLRSIFMPEWMSPASEVAGGAIRRGSGQMDALKRQMDAEMEPHYPAMNKLDEFGMDAFMNRAEGGNAERFKDWKMPDELKPALDVIAKYSKAYKDKAAATLKDPEGAIQDWNENWLPHMYSNYDKAKGFFEGGGGGGVRGSAGSLNKRSMPTYEDARVERGLDRKFKNPLDAMKAYGSEFGKFLALKQAENEMAAGGHMKFALPEGRIGASGQGGERPGMKIHPDWVPVDAIRRAGMVAHMPRDAATVFQNHYDLGLKRNPNVRPFVDAATKINNSATQVELGLLNAFHFAVTGNESGLSNLSRAISEARGGLYSDALRSAATAPIAPVSNYRAGRRWFAGETGEKPWTALDKIFGKMEPLDAHEHIMLKAAQDANAVPGRSYAPDVNMSDAEDFYKSWMRNSLTRELKETWAKVKDNPFSETPKQLLQAIGRALQTTSAPLFSHYIPALKMGSLMENARAAIKLGKWDIQNNPADYDKLVRFLRKEGNAIDNRLGELNINNSFMNKALQQGAYIGMRSFGWFKGTAGALGGGYGGAAKDIGASIFNRDPRSGFQKLNNKLDMTHQDYDPNFAYALAFPIGIGFMSAVYQFLKTGEPPKSVEDLYAPRTGGKVPGLGGRGQVEERVILPGYHKDVLGWYHNPVQEAYSKLNVGVSTAAEQVTGKDFYGPIVRPRATLAQSAADRLHHVGEKLTPMFVKGVINTPKQGSNLNMLERGVGMRSAGTQYTDPKALGDYLASKAQREWDAKQRVLQRRELGGVNPPKEPKLKRGKNAQP